MYVLLSHLLKSRFFEMSGFYLLLVVVVVVVVDDDAFGR